MPFSRESQKYIYNLLHEILTISSSFNIYLYYLKSRRVPVDVKKWDRNCLVSQQTYVRWRSFNLRSAVGQNAMFSAV